MPNRNAAIACTVATTLALATALVVARGAAQEVGPHAGHHMHGPFVQGVLTTPRTRWIGRDTPHAHLHALAGSGADARLPTLGDAVEAARAADLEWLGTSDDGPPLELLFVGTREQMRPFTGGTPGGSAQPDERAALLVAPAAGRPALRHELMHVLSWQRWGTPGGQWLSEGVATAAVGGCHGHSLHAIAAAIIRDGRHVPVAELRRAFVVAGDRGITYYIEAGSLAEYVRERFGRDGLRRLWATGLRGVQASLGVDQAELERGWRARIAMVAPAPGTVYGEVGREGCE
jgi:hypothetical protein